MSDRVALSWDRRSCRWFKRFRIPGSTQYKTYCVSAKALHEQTGCAPTKAGSEKAAREWWRIKQNELLSGETADSVTVAISRRLAKDAAIAAKIGDASTAAILHAAAAEISRRRINGEAIPEYDHEEGTFVVDQSPRMRLSNLLLERRESALRALDLDGKQESASGGTLREATDQYKEYQRQEVRAGELSSGVYMQTALHLDRLAKFVGDGDLSRIDETKLAKYRAHLLSQPFSSCYQHAHFKTTRAFLKWCWETRRLEELPRNINSRKLSISIKRKAPSFYTREQVEILLRNASKRTRLYILLCLNCGLTQCDLAALHPSEFDPKACTLTRKRTKTADHEAVPVVCYRLWDETAELLAKERSNDPERLLLNENGLPLLSNRLDEDGNHSKTDSVSLAFNRLKAKLKNRNTLDLSLSLKHFRKTGANIIRAEFGIEYSGLYLGHSPRSLQDVHYTQYSQAKFDSAVLHLGRVLGLAD